jgi:hypothetical protein
MRRDADIEYQILVALERAVGYHVYCPHLGIRAPDGTLAPYETTRGHLLWLSDRGIVAETKSNHWRLTAAGHLELERLRERDTTRTGLCMEHD